MNLVLPCSVGSYVQCVALVINAYLDITKYPLGCILENDECSCSLSNWGTRVHFMYEVSWSNMKDGRILIHYVFRGQIWRPFADSAHLYLLTLLLFLPVQRTSIFKCNIFDNSNLFCNIY